MSFFPGVDCVRNLLTADSMHFRDRAPQRLAPGWAEKSRAYLDEGERSSWLQRLVFTLHFKEGAGGDGDGDSALDSTLGFGL